MKLKFLTLAILLTSVLAFAQKKEIRKASNAVEDGNYAEAKSLIKKAEPQISSERDRIKGDFYLAKGQAFLGMNGRGVPVEDLVTAGESFKKAIKFGEEEDGKKGLEATEKILINGGIANQRAQHFEQAYKKMYAAYQLRPTDTVYLFAAANSALNGQIDDKAIEFYEKLKTVGYTGRDLQYVATNKATGKERVFGNKSQRDLFVKSGDYEDPKVKRAESKVGKITKRLAILYMQNGQKDKAMEAIEEAKRDNPNDLQLMMTEATLYQEMGDNEKYSELIKKIIKEDPENATLYYNLGVTSYNMDMPEEAEKYYKKAIKYDPEMAEAYSAYGGILLDKQKAIVDTMNTLGMSDADTKKYDKLSKERNGLIKEALPYMKKALKYDPENVEVMRTLYQLNVQLGKKEEAEKYKSMMKENAPARQEGK